MKKRYIAIIIILVIAAIFGIYKLTYFGLCKNHNSEALLEFCCSQESDSVKRSACYTKFATNLESLNICDQIEWELGNARCYYSVGVKKQDSEICSKINNESISNYDLQEIKDNCYEMIIQSSKDFSLCNNIIKEMNRETCFTKKAKAEKNADVCFEIALDNNRTNEYRDINYCIYDVAKISDDASICNRIIEKGNNSADITKDSCKIEVIIQSQDIERCKKTNFENISIQQCEWKLEQNFEMQEIFEEHLQEHKN